MYAYTKNNPVMYVNPSGEFGILATPLICTAISGLNSGGVEMGKQLINNDFDFNNLNWYDIGASALSGAATNGLNMIKAGLGQSARGATSFYFGGMMVGSGLWNVGKGVKNTINPIIRGISKFPSTFIPYKIIDDTLFSY